MRCFCKCCLRKFQYIGSKIVYWSKVFLSKGMVLYFFQKGCYIRTGILVILRCNVISIVIVLTKNRAQEIWTNEKIEFKTTISLCNFDDFIQWFTLRPRENLNLGAINIKNKLLWNNFTISYPSYKHSNYLGLDISAPLFFCFIFEHFLDNAFLVRRKTFPKESYLILFFL